MLWQKSYRNGQKDAFTEEDDEEETKCSDNVGLYLI